MFIRNKPTGRDCLYTGPSSINGNEKRYRKVRAVEIVYNSAKETHLLITLKTKYNDCKPKEVEGYIITDKIFVTKNDLIDRSKEITYF